MENIEKVLPQLIDCIFERETKELLACSREDLEKYWFFSYNHKLTAEANTYAFIDAMEMYKYHTERWEEHYHGSICIVERVRDKYLMPKIKQFNRELYIHMGELTRYC